MVIFWEHRHWKPSIKANNNFTVINRQRRVQRCCFPCFESDESYTIDVIDINECTSTQLKTRSRECTHSHTFTHYARANIPTHRNAHAYTYASTHIHTYAWSYQTHTHTHTHAQTRAHAPTCTDTPAIIHTHKRAWKNHAEIDRPAERVCIRGDGN